ncbi:MAG: hypothetical protein ISQ06_14890, partial [Planctomycetaceae bacterium]|nr:hypothetical protein [Planctomycetaceae bacterium]
NETGCPVVATGIDVHPRLEFNVEDSISSKVSTLYIQEMAKRGCHGYTSFYLNAAQGKAEIEQTVDAARATFALIKDALDTNTVDGKLECPPRGDAFRRLVR